MRHTVKRQLRLNLTGNNLRTKPQPPQSIDKHGPVLGIARGARQRSAHGIRLKRIHFATKLAAHRGHPLDGRIAKRTRRVHALAQIRNNRMLIRIDNDPVLNRRQKQARRDGSQIN